MDYHIKFISRKQRRHRRRVTNVSLDEVVIRVGQMPGDIRTLVFRLIKIVKIVNDRDLPAAFGEQSVDKMRTNKSGTAGDEDIFHYTHY